MYYRKQIPSSFLCSAEAVPAPPPEETAVIPIKAEEKKKIPPVQKGLSPLAALLLLEGFSAQKKERDG